MDFVLQDASLELVGRIFGVVFPLAAVAVTGFFYARLRPTDMAVANRINIDVFIPALIFSVLAGSDFDLVDYAPLAMASAMVVAGSALIAFPFCRLLSVHWRTLLPPMMFNNCGNLGIPLMVLAFGESALPAAIIMFVVSTLLHFTVGVYMLDRHGDPFSLLRMPMILATIAGLIWSYGQWPLPEPVMVSVDMLGQIAIPLMLFALGVRMIDVDFRQWRLGLTSMVLSPLSGVIMALLIQPWVQLEPIRFGYLILFASLPPAVLNYMLSEKYNQEPAKVAAMVLMGNLGGLLFIPVALAIIL